MLHPSSLIPELTECASSDARRAIRPRASEDAHSERVTPLHLPRFHNLVREMPGKRLSFAPALSFLSAMMATVDETRQQQPSKRAAQERGERRDAMITIGILFAAGAATLLVLALNRQSGTSGAWAYSRVQALAQGEERGS